MAHNIIISPLAHLDEFEAYEWYEEQKPGLGEELLFELEKAYSTISQHPAHYGFIDDKKDLRDYLIRRFPFLIVYRIRASNVEVITVHHTSKHPSGKYGNLDQ